MNKQITRESGGKQKPSPEELEYMKQCEEIYAEIKREEEREKWGKHEEDDDDSE